MSRSIEQVLDTCLAQLNNGLDLEVILEAHPDEAYELRPLLAAAAWARIEIPPPLRRDEHKAALLAAVAAWRRTVEATNGLVNELKAGVPATELIARSPEDTRLVVTAAWRMHTTLPPVPSPERMAQGKRRLMAMAAERRAARSARVPAGRHLQHLRGALGVLRAGLLPAPTAARRAWSGAMAMTTAVLILTVGLAGIGTAAASSLPGGAFYNVKRLGESARMLFAFDPEQRADLNLRYSGRRLQEMRRLAGYGREVPLTLVEAWLQGHTNAWAEIQQLPVEQQRLLAEALLASVAERAEIEGRLRQSVADPAGLEELLVWARALAESARESAGLSVPPEATEVVEPLPAAPRPLPRPLPPEDVNPASSAVESPAPAVPVLQPALPQAAEATHLPDQAPPPVVQPGNDTPAGADRERGNEAPPAQPEPSEPPAPATTEPPPYFQPPIEELAP